MPVVVIENRLDGLEKGRRWSRAAAVVVVVGGGVGVVLKRT